MNNYYKILSVSPDASAEEIKKAYRKLAKLLHPDVNKSPSANEQFILINEAHEVLTDKNRRYLFDLKLQYASGNLSPLRKNPNSTAGSPPNFAHQHFHYDWASFQKANKGYQDKYSKIPPLIYNLFFACGMFVGFLIAIVSIVGTFLNYWPIPFIFIAVPGIILIVEGWKGITGKKSFLKPLFRWIKKIFA